MLLLTDQYNITLYTIHGISEISTMVKMDGYNEFVI